MEEKKESRKCVIKSKDYSNLYFKGGAMYVNSEQAEVFDYDKLPDYLKKSTRDEIIFLDTPEGLEFLVRQIEFIDGQIPEVEYKLNSLNESREKFYNANPKMVSEYIQEHNKKIHPVIGISKEQKESIIKDIVSKKD